MELKNYSLSVALVTALLALSACKQSGSNDSRTKIRKGNPTATANSAKDNKTTLPGNSKSGQNSENKDKKADAESTQDELNKNKSTCEEMSAVAKSNGWKIDSVETSDKKIKINFYVLEKSVGTFANPVLYFNRSAFQHIRKEDLERFKSADTDYKIDPVLMDMRGSGCSSKLPDLKTKASELNQYGSQFAVQDAELIREKLKIKKWKILAHRSGGIVAFKYVQNSPSQVSAISVADFSPMKNQTELMKLRLKQESVSWGMLLKEQDLTTEDVDKAIKNLGADKDLIHLFAQHLTEKTMWASIAKDIKALRDGSLKSAELKDRLKVLQDKSALRIAARILDIDQNRSLSACSEALKDENKAAVNSCKLEALVDKGTSNSSLKNALNHDPLKMDVIKKNIEKEKITYKLFEAGLSTIYPLESYLEHEKDMKSITGFEDNLRSLENTGSEIYLEAEFLNSLQ